MLFKKRKPIKKCQIEGMVRQIKYLTDVKKVSDGYLASRLREMLEGLGVKTEYFDVH